MLTHDKPRLAVAHADVSPPVSRAAYDAILRLLPRLDARQRRELLRKLKALDETPDVATLIV